MITHLVFDLGNVVLTNDWHFNCPEKDQAFSAFFHISSEDMERGWDAGWPAFSVGKTSEIEFWNTFLTTAGASTVDVQKAKQLYREYQFEIEGMFGLLDRWKDKYKLAVLSNISKEWLEFKKKKFSLDQYFETYVASGEVGIDKPHKEIY